MKNSTYDAFVTNATTLVYDPAIYGRPGRCGHCRQHEATLFGFGKLTDPDYKGRPTMLFRFMKRGSGKKGALDTRTREDLFKPGGWVVGGMDSHRPSHDFHCPNGPNGHEVRITSERLVELYQEADRRGLPVVYIR